MGAPLTSAALSRQQRWIILGAAALVVAALYALLISTHPPAALWGSAWTRPMAGEAATATMDHAMNRSMAHHGMHHGDFWPTFAMWWAMMVAMMLPPVLPWIWFFAAATRPVTTARGLWGRTLVFSSGYFALWALYSLGAAYAQLRLHHAAMLDPDLLRLAPRAGGGLLVLAGAVQFSPVKNACLKHCRSPVSYFLTRWRDGPRGAFSMGFRHGLFCLGCCWALMALSFVLGTMNLLWMAALTIMLCIEKIAPGGETFSKAMGVLLLGWGALLLAG